MCGRFALTLPKQAMRVLFNADAPEADDAVLDLPRHNIRPTERIWTVLGAGQDPRDPDAGRRLAPMRWGFAAPWAKRLDEGPLLINARSETLAEKPAFRDACRRRRCLIPADGFYEWRHDAGRGREPHWIAPTDGAPLAFAGVWSLFRDAKDGTETATVAIVTIAANAALTPLHPRLPLALAPEAWALWLGEAGHGAAALMRTPDEAFYAHHPVSRRINIGGRAAPDEPSLRAPMTLEEQAAERPFEDEAAPRLL